MKIETLQVGDLDTNCYILDINNKVVIIDPGDDFDRIKKQIGNREVVGVLITHFHFDHIGDLEEVMKNNKNLPLDSKIHILLTFYLT